MSPDINDYLSSPSTAWEQYWHYFYSSQPQIACDSPNDPQKSKIDSFPHVSRDTLNAVLPVEMHHDDQLSVYSLSDPSRYNATPMLFTGRVGSTVSAVDLNVVPKDIFAYIPEWLPTAQKIDQRKQDEVRWEMRKQGIEKGAKKLPEGMLSLIGRLADGAFAHLGHWFKFSITQTLRPLAHRLKVAAKKTTDSLMIGVEASAEIPGTLAKQLWNWATGLFGWFYAMIS